MMDYQKRLESIVKYSIDKPVDYSTFDNILNVLINGVVFCIPLMTSELVDSSVDKLFESIKSAFSNDVVDVFFDDPVFFQLTNRINLLMCMQKLKRGDST